MKYNQIFINYNDAIRKADELEEIADNLSRIANQNMEEALRTVSNSWGGENSQIYVSKGNTLKNKIETNANQLRKTARAIRTIAANTKRAELRAWEIANDRTY